MSRSRLRRLAVIVLTTVMGCYLATCAALYGLQRTLSFPAPNYLMAVSDGSSRVDVPGGTFFLWRVVSDAGPVVVHFHGNGDQVSFLSSMSQQWGRVGVSFAAVEYPGYPGTEGEPSEASILAAAEAALAHLTGPMKVERSRIVLSGQSLGTGVALAMARRGWGVRLVLISPYTSWADVAGHAFPYLPTGLLIRDRFESAALAPGVNVPTLVIHGTQDTIVPFAQGERISSAIPGARLFTVTGGHHHDVLEWGKAEKELVAFVAQR